MRHNRVQPGVPAGGQFAASSHDESDVVLSDHPSIGSVEVVVIGDATTPLKTITVDLATPPPHPITGCDWTDPTRPLDAFTELDTRSHNEARHRSETAVMKAVKRSAPPFIHVTSAITHDLAAWEDWANDRFAQTGEQYYADFANGLTAAKASMCCADLGTEQIAVEADLVRWQDTSELSDNLKSLASEQFIEGKVYNWLHLRRWETNAEMSSGDNTSGGRDGALMFGRTLARVPGHGPPT